MLLPPALPAMGSPAPLSAHPAAGVDPSPAAAEPPFAPAPQATAPKTDVPDVKQAIFGKVTGERIGEQVAGIGDVNNDGYDDFAILSHTRGLAYVYWGGPTLREAPVRMLEGTGLPLTDQSQIRPAGDLDNDGFADVVITAPGFYLPSMRAVGAVFVFYGTPSGLKAAPDQTLYGHEADGRFGMGVDSLGDINRDGYSDLIIGADGTNGDTGSVFIYLGGPRGLEENPIWTWNGEGKGDRFGHAVTGAGDLNGDGWPDFAVGAPFAVSGDSRGKVYIFYGTSSMADMKVGRVLQGQMLRSYFGLSIRLAGDVNNDGFSDLVIASPDTSSGTYPGAGQVSLYLGSEKGIKDSPVRIIEGESNNSHLGFTIAYLGDVNRDGCDDVAIGSQFFSSPDMPERGKVYVFFGDRTNGFSAEPKVEEVGTAEGQHLSGGLAGAGDVDGDGFADMLVGAPGYNSQGNDGIGAVYLFKGSDMTMPPMTTKAVRVEGRDEGDLLLEEYRYYHLCAAITHRTGLRQVGTVELHLDPDGQDVTFTYYVQDDRMVETRDPDGLATAGSVSVLDDPLYRDTYDLWVDVKLDWGFPTDRTLSVSVLAVDRQGLRVGGDYDGLGRVVGALAFAGTLAMRGDRQGPLHDGDWVLGSEGVTFSGLGVQYDLAAAGVDTKETYSPPQGTCAVAVRDDMGGEWRVGPAQGETVSLRAVAPAVSRTDLVYTISIETPDRATVFRTLGANVRVDSTPVRFESPEPSSVIASLRDTVSIVIVDPLGPGVDPYSAEYSLNLAGGDNQFGPWKVASVRPSGTGVVAEAYELFTEGMNFIKWRALDRVGNGPTESWVCNVTVDLGNITFGSSTPPGDVWYSTPSVSAGITVENTKGNPLDVSHIQYRTSTSPGLFSDWQTVPTPATGTPSRAGVSVVLSLAEGRSNYIQWRARDLERREYITSPLYRIQVDLSGPTFSDPAPPQDRFVGDRMAIAASVLVNDDLSGVAEGTVQYQLVGDSSWYSPTVVREGSGLKCTAMLNLPEGPDNYVRWQALDAAGQASPPFQQRIMVDRTPPTFSDFSPRPDAVVRTSIVEVSVRLDDRDARGDPGSGVDLGALEYALSRPSTRGYTPWAKPERYATMGVVPFYMVTFPIALDDGDANYIILRVSDGTGNNTARSEEYRIVASLPVPPPEQPPVVTVNEPKGPVVRYGTATYFDSVAYSPQSRALTYTWYSSIDGVLSDRPSFSAILSEGKHTITLTVKEAVPGGLSRQVTFDIDVAPPVAPHPPLSGLGEQVALVLIVAFIVIAAVLQRVRIKGW